MPVDETPEERIERIRQEGATTRQQGRLTFFMSIANLIVTSILIPLMLRSYHQETVQKVDATKTEITAVKSDASVAATKAQKTEVLVAENAAKLDEKLNANLLQWQAYNSKQPEDMVTAHQALGKAISPE